MFRDVLTSLCDRDVGDKELGAFAHLANHLAPNQQVALIKSVMLMKYRPSLTLLLIGLVVFSTAAYTRRKT